MKKAQIILGIDPGTNHMGYGLIKIINDDVELVHAGTLSLSAHLDAYSKLEQIFRTVRTVIRMHKPTSMAIEAPFYGKNVQSMLKLGRAQGVAIAAGITAGLDITEYAPRKIKQAITGKGQASKHQVAKMLETLLALKLDDYKEDATDAIGVAYCHYLQGSRKLSSTSNYSGWGDFIKQNPTRKKG